VCLVAFFRKSTSVQNNVVNHVALVFGVVEAERAAQVFRKLLGCVVVVTGLHMHIEGIPEIDLQAVNYHFFFFCCMYILINVIQEIAVNVRRFSIKCFLTCSRWKRSSLCIWRASCHRGGPCSADADSACIQSWTHRTHMWGRHLDDRQTLLSRQVLSWKTFDCGRPACND